jgi:hypothetical protein
MRPFFMSPQYKGRISTRAGQYKGRSGWTGSRIGPR